MLPSRYQKFASLLLILIFTICLSFADDETIYQDKGRRDPFIELVTPDGRILNLESTGREAKISIEGIIYQKDSASYAIINGEIVTVGDYVGGCVVFKIEEDKVIVLKENKPVEYKLKKEGI